MPVPLGLFFAGRSTRLSQNWRGIAGFCGRRDFRMVRSSSWLKSALGAASTTILVCSIAIAPAFASSADPAPTHPSTAGKRAIKKRATSSTAHASSTKSGKSKKTRAALRKSKYSKKASRKGQQKIDAERTHQIQEALIRQHYLTGEPTGKWDASTEDALRRFQADHGWQNKTVPDSRALIKLGLGPNHDHLLNPESAMTTAPETPSAARVPASARAPNGPSAPASQPQQ